MTRTTKFQSYQEELLSCIRDSLQQKYLGNKENQELEEGVPITSKQIKVDNQTEINLIRLLPILLQGFIDNSNKWDTDGRITDGTSKKQQPSSSSLSSSAKKDDITIVQFQLFAQWVKVIQSRLADLFDEHR